MNLLGAHISLAVVVVVAAWLIFLFYLTLKNKDGGEKPGRK